MGEILVKSLIERNIISEDTVITAIFPAKSLGDTIHMQGEFVFEKLSELNGIEYIQAFRPANQIRYRLLLNNITKVDGMGLNRLASIYGLKSDGTTKAQKIDPITGQPIRRGRKPKRFKENNDVGLNTA